MVSGPLDIGRVASEGSREWCGMTSVHISVLLDRSGSMAAIADEVVTGYNEFLAEQRAEGDDAIVTLVQFDSYHPHEVLADAVPIREVTALDRSRYAPRGSTPLYDAIGMLISRADGRVANLEENGLPPEDQVVLIITDGLENASVEHRRSTIFELVERRQEDGWVFVFLGAGQDAYAEGGRVGVKAGNRAGWKTTSEGTSKMWKDVSHSTKSYRSKSDHLRAQDRDRFYEEDPDQK